MDIVPDRLYEEDPWSEPICQNCCYFFHHEDDDDSMGICSLDKAFDPYWDDEVLMESMDFSCCRDLYLQRCFDGQREACDSFEQALIEDIPEDMSIDTYMYIESMKNADPDKLFQNLQQEDREIALRAMNQLFLLIHSGNVKAYESLISYFRSLDSAISLEEVHYRIKLIEAMSHLPRSEKFIELYVNELARTPSNNTTRRLYTIILKELGRYPQEEICGPLEQLLNNVKYSNKIKRRIMEVAGMIEKEEDSVYFYWQRN